MGITCVKLIAWNECEEHLCRLHVTKDRHRRVCMHAGKLACTVNALVYLSHTFTHTCTYTWRAAHLVNRLHYTGGWIIDPLVEELKKSPFSSPPSRMCDMMSWSYLPALSSMAANLTCSPRILHMVAKMSGTKVGGQKTLLWFLRVKFWLFGNYWQYYWWWCFLQGNDTIL